LARGNLNLPVRGEVIATFGRKRHPEFNEYVFQKGIEIQAPIGEPILAVEAGKVVFSGRFTGYGKLIILDHGSGYFTVYAHASELLKKEGDSVKKGETIALVGDTDSIKGPYLYFEVRKDGKPEDPLLWLAKGVLDRRK
jgi:septal ring factor EnvC (AmiA/AmiB activator)